jgi:hypothetical protein
VTYAQHPYYDDFWRERSVKARWRDLDVPTLEIAGWYDRYRDGMVANFQARKENVWLVAGPWQHGMPAGQYADIGAAGNAYPLPCNGSDNQNWLVIQRAAGSALLLQNLETRRYLYQNSSNFYSTTDKLDLNAKVLRWTIG